MRLTTWTRGSVAAVAWAALLIAGASNALACSPPFEPITLRDLGPGQVVVVGTIGDRVTGGRIFQVDRWFNGGVPTATIVIAFKEGEAVGDCSYPVQTGQRLIIAPALEPDGRLSADLVTPQGDPASDVGQRYLREATALYGQGIVPPAAGPAPDTTSTSQVPLILGVVVLVIVAVSVASAVVRRRRRTSPGPGSAGPP